MPWDLDTLKELLDRELAHARRETELREQMAQRLRECNNEQMAAADRVAEARIATLTARADQADRTHAAAIDRLSRLVYLGVGIALAIEFLIPLLKR